MSVLCPKSFEERELRAFMKRSHALAFFTFQIHRLSFVLVQYSLPFGSPVNFPASTAPIFSAHPGAGFTRLTHPSFICAKPWYPNIVLSFQHHL